jgi:PII-like signaling protein
LGLTIFAGERPLAPPPVCGEIVHRAHVAGATVLRGAEGYGAWNHIHTTRILSLSGDLPMLITIVEEAGQVREFLPQLDEFVSEGWPARPTSAWHWPGHSEMRWTAGPAVREDV